VAKILKSDCSSETNEMNKQIIEQPYLLKVLILSRVICEDVEVMVQYIGIHGVVRIQDNVKADTSIDTIAKCADLLIH